MSKFVKEGSVPEADLRLEESKALREEQNYLEQEDLKNRKSLHEQLYDNRVRKALEFQQLTEKQNSAHKISERDLQYYELLQKKAELQELDRRIEEEEQLQERRMLKIKAELLKRRLVKQVDPPTKVQKKVSLRTSVKLLAKNKQRLTPIASKVVVTNDEIKKDEPSTDEETVTEAKKTGVLVEYDSSSDDE